MTNEEKWAKEIVEIAKKSDFIAVVDGKPCGCLETHCEDCMFYTVDCGKGRKIWCETECKEPSVDWSRVPPDTKVLVSHDGERWHKRYFAIYHKGSVLTFALGTTSWSSEWGMDSAGWPYAKLAEEDEND